ncbi:MAG: GNAT family N-acetyltransferase [Acetobacteraceae bacterium]|nr:GNAT family N-acetyltransferase [Acetobacteraceae bacterium]
MADVFVRAFPGSLRHYFGATIPRPSAFADLFAFLHRAEPLGFRVAEAGGRVVGYAVALSSVSRLVRAAVSSPYLLKFIAGLLLGTYGVRPASVARLAWDKVRMGLSPSMVAVTGGEILSVAVAPEVRGQGVGRRLACDSLDWLRKAGVRRVRLEVRPDNVAALSLYKSLGFKVIGRAADSEGPTLVMAKDLRQA